MIPETPQKPKKADYAPRQWRCLKCDSVLGLVVRPGAVRMLQVFREPVMPRSPGAAMAAGAVVATVTGQASVACGVCGAVREWSVAGDAMAVLVADFEKRGLG